MDFAQRSPNGDLPSDLRDSVGVLFSEPFYTTLGEFCNSIEIREERVDAFARVLDEYYLCDGLHEYEAPETQILLDSIADSLYALDRHLKGHPEISALDATIRMINHGKAVGDLRDCTIDIVFPSRQGLVLWERFEVSLQYPTLTYANFSSCIATAAYQFTPVKASKPEVPLYRYHPERFRAFHDFTDWLRRFYDLQIDKRSGLPTLDQLNLIGRHIVEDLNQKALRDVPLRPRLHREKNTSGPMDSVIALSMKWGRFVQSGKQIFDFPPAMIEMFKQTDVEEIPLNMIRMPYACQYMHFGPQLDLELEPGWLVDGAYIERFGEEGDFAVTITTSPIDHANSALWPGYSEPYFQQGFLENYRTMDLGTAVDEVMSSRLASLQKEIGQVPGIKDITERVQAEAEANGKEIPKGIKILDRSSINSLERQSTDNHRFPIYRSALRLVVNALCYITAYPDDVQEGWPSETPERLKAQAGAQKFKEARNARSKLEALGYLPVHFCGRDWETQREATHLAPSLGGARKGVAIHWRRGHWKRQPHGEGRKLRKLIWIMPTLVGHDETGRPTPLGHVYLVS